MPVGMLAAMSTPPVRSSSQATAATRDRGDACPGTLRLHAADDGALARVRVPGGVLTTRQAEALAEAAGRLGDGDLHLTSRGNVQLRGLAEGCGGELAASLDAAGLMPSAGHERVRNIVASPLSGLDGRGLRDVRPWLSALDGALCASEAARELSGRFLFALDDGRGDVAALDADVTVRAAEDGGALLSLGTAGESLAVSGADASRAALTAAETFLEAARESGARVWRVTELPFQDGLLRRVRDRLAAAGVGVGSVSRGRAESVTAGAEGGPPPGAVADALSVHAPLGRLTPLQWRELTALAVATPCRELRLTPWRGVVVPAPGLSEEQAADALARLSVTGLVTDPASPWLGVGACIGRPGCAKSRADVRADATESLAAAGRAELPLYWSGCERRCGHPRGGRIDVVAVEGGGYELSRTAPGQSPRTAPMTDPSRLAAALGEITP
ncbi:MULTISPECIES: precorrin-3B synthase [Streptomyces]|uniref:precorrin-3B synthase n=1 Tax=Streptomyces TaxID=1883 RepID=UPI0004E7ADC4|nr:cobalamin biosynthesis protein CobG [Streptomyces scabiei]MBP5909893.1 precorrin-3B synthase [Streptomyces sp. LBUM 1478]MBP5912472.1 precorrin-3B synthase [Streptomyces sp. LBUM 1486]MBP5919620.1 precorrin-3B synthase [Streptomyces sp. LBUM 1483]MBP5927145.1 precorrin-3B synthase [Streptomyces sp. LBUM 1479]QTU58068.1 precorrin-3B synthase [Streptomyces sp. LBUM 1480]